MTAPIRAYVGPNGEGKSLAAMVLSVVPTLMQGRRVLSTCMIDPIEARRWCPNRAGEPQV
jgi:ABC-type branched-subunit amino acid transport system ATPase component